MDDDYSALIVCWIWIVVPTIMVFAVFGPATVFDTIVEGFKTIFGGLLG